MGFDRISLRLRDIVVRYGELRAVDSCSFSVEVGRLVLLTGHNGAGKTSCLRAIAGLEPIRAGTVELVEGETAVNVNVLTPSARAESGLTLIPSTNAIFPNLTVLENLHAATLPFRSKDLSQQIDHVLTDIFPALQLLVARPAGALSGGERQQLSIAISLVQKPRIIMLDEPSAGVAPHVVDRIAAVLRELADGGAAVLVAEQNLHAFLPVATDVLVMKRGTLVHSGTADQASPTMLWDLF